jgi:hypothetical protein
MIRLSLRITKTRALIHAHQHIKLMLFGPRSVQAVLPVVQICRSSNPCLARGGNSEHDDISKAKVEGEMACRV